jgi:hypothetical protein
MYIMDESLNNTKLRERAEALLAAARSRSAEVQRAFSAISGNSELYARLASALAQIDGAASQLSLALDSPTATLRLSDLEAIAAAVNSADIQGLVASAAAAGTPAAVAQELATSSAATHAQVQTLAGDLFEKKLFDPYLHFANAEEEAAFRRRQAETQQYVAAQLAKDTPEGNLNAGGGMVDAMIDARAHGASDSPDFTPRLSSLVETVRRQHAAMRAAGQSTEEFDDSLTLTAR